MNFQASEHSEYDLGFVDPFGLFTQGATTTGAAVGSALVGLSASGPAPITGIAPNVLPLRRGAKGAQVKQLQLVLKETGNDPGKIDEDFGPRTEAAVQAFQRARGLPASGVVDATTLRWLEQMLINVRQGGMKDKHVAPPPVAVQPADMTPQLGPTSFYDQPWFLPAVVGTGLVVAAVVGYVVLRKR